MPCFVDRFNIKATWVRFSEQAKHEWRDGLWAEDLKKAFDAGKRMAKAAISRCTTVEKAMSIFSGRNRISTR